MTDQQQTTTGAESAPLPAVQEHISRLGMVLPDNLSFEQWHAVGSKLRAVHGSLLWAVGDWWAYGEAKGYGERLKASDALGLSPQTITNAANVARRFECNRRRLHLSFGHHAEVAALEAARADQVLEQAEQEAWSRADLRRHVATLEREPEPAQPGPPATGVYKAIVAIIRARIKELGWTMWQCDERSGVQDGYTSKVLNPDSPSGRVATWPTLQLLADALWPGGLTLRAEAADEQQREHKA